MQFYRHQDTSLKMPPILSYCILHVAMTATVNTRFEKKVPEIMNQNLGQQFALQDRSQQPSPFGDLLRTQAGGLCRHCDVNQLRKQL